MKKLISILLILVTLLSLVGCSNNSLEVKIVSDGKKSLSTFKPTVETIAINNTKTGYVISVENAQREYYLTAEDTKTDEFVLKNYKEITDPNILETIAYSKHLVINYINASFVLKNKETLINYITNLPFKSADFPNKSLIAGFNSKLDVVFVNIDSNSVDAHTIVHELFHALSKKTRNNSNFETYCTTTFDEAFTELLATSVIASNYPTIYDEYIKYVYYFIGSHELDSITTYFYGLENVQVSTTEFHLYTIAVQNIMDSSTPEDKNSEELTIHLILSKWIL